VIVDVDTSALAKTFIAEVDSNAVVALSDR